MTPHQAVPADWWDRFTALLRPDGVVMAVPADLLDQDDDGMAGFENFMRRLDSGASWDVLAACHHCGGSGRWSVSVYPSGFSFV